MFQVESKWLYLPITPTYDQYVHRWVTIPEREGFHLKTRSVMKQLFEGAKWMVLSDERNLMWSLNFDFQKKIENQI